MNAASVGRSALLSTISHQKHMQHRVVSVPLYVVTLTLPLDFFETEYSGVAEDARRVFSKKRTNIAGSTQKSLRGHHKYPRASENSKVCFL